MNIRNPQIIGFLGCLVVGLCMWKSDVIISLIFTSDNDVNSALTRSSVMEEKKGNDEQRRAVLVGPENRIASRGNSKKQLRAEEVARKILSSSKVPEKTNATAVQPRPVSSPPKTDAVAVQMPEGWQKLVWNDIWPKDRPIVLQLAQMGYISGFYDKPHSVFSAGELDAFSRGLANGEYRSWNHILHLCYFRHYFDNIRVSNRIIDSANRGNQAAKQQVREASKSFTSNYEVLMKLMGGGDVHAKLMEYLTIYPKLFRN